jgi:hypothetical protein
MPRVKVKKLIPKDMGNDQEALTELFEQMTGVKDADIDIILPKYIDVMNMLRKFYKLYRLLSELNAFVDTFSEFVWITEIKQFLQEMIDQCGLDHNNGYKVETLRHEFVEKKMSPDQIKEYVNQLYRKVKTSQVIKKIMVTSANLSPFRIHLSLDSPSDTFIKREPGDMFAPLGFTTLDLKLIWSYDVEPKCLKFILSILQHTYKLSYDIYDTIYSPDVDIGEFSGLLINTIAKLRKQIPRCDKAFDVIENSVNMLRSNFKDYFRLSVESENPSTILESFIIDVAGSQKANPSVVSQFRRITSFMKKNASNSNDPRVKKLFSMLNTQFGKIDNELKVDTRLNAEKDNESMAEELIAEETTIEEPIEECVEENMNSVSSDNLEANITV